MGGSIIRLLVDLELDPRTGLWRAEDLLRPGKDEDGEDVLFHMAPIEIEWQDGTRSNQVRYDLIYAKAFWQVTDGYSKGWLAAQQAHKLHVAIGDQDSIRIALRSQSEDTVVSIDAIKEVWVTPYLDLLFPRARPKWMDTAVAISPGGHALTAIFVPRGMREITKKQFLDLLHERFDAMVRELGASQALLALQNILVNNHEADWLHEDEPEEWWEILWMWSEDLRTSVAEDTGEVRWPFPVVEDEAARQSIEETGLEAWAWEAKKVEPDWF